MKMTKKLAGLILALGFVLVSNPGVQAAETDVAVNATNFPDVYFRSYVATHVDKDSDSKLSAAELNAVTELDLDRRNISSLKGLEVFANLESLSCMDNRLTNLDVSANKKLTALDCNGNDLAMLDVSANEQLNSLDCSSNSIVELLFGNITKVQTLDFAGNRMSSVNLSKLTSLLTLNAANNELTTLSVTKNTMLTTISCQNNYILTLDASANVKLESIVAYGNQMTSLVVGSKPRLKRLMCNDNNLTTLDVSGAVELDTLNCSKNQLTELSLTNNAQLEVLSCYSNALTTLSIMHMPELISVNCSKNHLGSVDLPASVTVFDGSDNVLALSVDAVTKKADMTSISGAGFGNVTDWVNASGSVEDGTVVVNDISKVFSYVYPAATGKNMKVTVNPVTTKKLSFALSNVSMSKGTKFTMKASVFNGNVKPVYTSTNSNVATVDSNGSITAVGTGETTIAAVLYGYETAECKVTVCRSLNGLSIAAIPAQTYSGQECKPIPVITDDQGALVAGTDFTVEYTNNKEVGTAILSVNGTGSCRFSFSREFAIHFNIANTSVEEIKDQSYTGSEVKPTAVVKNGTVVLSEGVDYELNYVNNTEIGTGIINIKGIGNYAGSKSVTFVIKIMQVQNLVKSGNQLNSVTLMWDKVDNVDGYRVYRYDSSKKKYIRVTTISSNGITTYVNSGLKATTAYRYKVRAMRKINGTNKFGAYSTILKTATKPAATTLKVVNKASKKAYLTWNKVSGATGYRVYMRKGTSGKFTKVKSITKVGTVKYTKSSLKKKSTYYFRVRAYKTVEGKNIYGAYTAKKKVVIKK